jgi:Putative zinc-finger
MKCEVCLQLLEEYIDGELKENEAESLSAHLVTCAACATEFESLTAEQEIYARYDRELTISPALWNEIAARTVNVEQVVEIEPRRSWREWFAVPSWGWSFAGAMALLIAAIALAVIYFQPSQSEPQQAIHGNEVKTPSPRVPETKPEHKPETPKTADQLAVSKPPKPSRVAPVSRAATTENKTVIADQSDVLFSDVAYSVVEERETQLHLENAQNLLRSVRNIEITEDDTDIDVTYEKALSRRLLSENVILRREAEMSGKFPTKTLLSDLEPFLIDIANLPDKPAADDLRVLKQRVQRTEIVAALQSGY